MDWQRGMADKGGGHLVEVSGGIGREGWRTLSGGQWRDWQRGWRTLSGGQWRDWQREVEDTDGGQWRDWQRGGGGIA
ncbi:unnamed protein product [Staurois parvus]|uniref:Uncharacterized protein n=1 Tax=Staurois parvus TaxID=386267 RepID=A0ABN9ASQ4_9NEOB|nr:unnamed protein product [Staurois parvus]